METVKWKPWGKYAIETRGYSISKALSREKWIYTLWKLPKTMLGNFGNVDDAKKAHLEIIRNQPAQPSATDSGIGLPKTVVGDYSRIKG